MDVTALIETYAENGATVLDLQGTLIDKVEWLPLSIVKLCNLTEINLSKNEIMALSSDIGELKALRKLDIHSNQLIDLPGSIGNLPLSMANLHNLEELYLRFNELESISESCYIKNLRILDIGNNFVDLTSLPTSIGELFPVLIKSEGVSCR